MDKLFNNFCSCKNKYFCILFLFKKKLKVIFSTQFNGALYFLIFGIIIIPFVIFIRQENYFDIFLINSNKLNDFNQIEAQISILTKLLDYYR